MADLKFNCTQCSQLISCDELWTGQEIQCPTCQTPLLVPARPREAQPSSLVPKPPSSAAKLSIGRPQHSPAHAAGTGGSSYMPAGNPMARKPAPPPKPKKSLLKIAGIGVGII